MVQSGFDLSLQNLADEGLPLNLSTLYSLSDLDRGQMAAVRGVWHGLSSERKQSVLSGLVDLAESVVEVDFSAFFREQLDDEGAEVRRLAIEGLWEVEKPWLLSQLVRLLSDDPMSDVRAAAAASLGRFVLLGELGQLDAALSTRAEQALLEAYFAADELLVVRRRVLESLAYSSESGVGDLIETAYMEGEDDLRLSALFAMGRSADRRWRLMLVDELENPAPAMRYEAAVACGELELRDAVEPLSRLVYDFDLEVGSAAVEALGKIGGPEAQRVLRSCCSSEDEALVEAAEEALELASWADSEDLEILDDWSLTEP